MRIVEDRKVEKVQLITPSDDGFVLFAAEIGRWLGPFLPRNKRRSALLAALQPLAREAQKLPDVKEATVFCGLLRPPGEGTELLNGQGLHHARFDVVLLIRTSDVPAARKLRGDRRYRQVIQQAQRDSKRTYEVVANNQALIGMVDHRPDHAYLFNYFYAENAECLLQVWEYTAGWFQVKTALANSALLRPEEGQQSTRYGLVNHASWPGLRSFLPALLFRPSFRSFVLANFKANGIAAQPIIYRRL